MNQEKIFKTLLAQIVSEKTTQLSSAHNQYVFKVRSDSNKKEIKAAVEALFGVNVENVTTANVRGKKKIFKGRAGTRASWKKAMVSVPEGQMIDISNA